MHVFQSHSGQTVCVRVCVCARSSNACINCFKQNVFVSTSQTGTYLQHRFSEILSALFAIILEVFNGLLLLAMVNGSA